MDNLTDAADAWMASPNEISSDRRSTPSRQVSRARLQPCPGVQYGMGRLVRKRIGDIKLQGYSVAGEETVIAVPELNVCFDIGRAPREAIPIDNVCLSHGHMDHAAGVAYYFSQRRFLGLRPGRLIVHRGLAPHIRRILDAWATIERQAASADIIGVDPLQDIEIRRGLAVRPFAVDHCAFALGYTLIERRRKLKPEFTGKSGTELVSLKSKGIEIEDTLEVPLITFSGDTAVGKFLELDFVRDSRVVLLECTFFERGHLERAKAGRHMHVNDLPRVMEAIPEARIVLTHVTRRTDIRAARRELEKTLCGANLDRVTFLMESNK